MQILPSANGLAAGSYTGHVTLTGGGTTKTVTVVLSITALPPVQHTVSLSWQVPTVKVVSYSMYRSTIQGGSYGMLASAIGGTSYTDQSAQSGTPYYYVVTAIDSQGRESKFSNEFKAIIP
jgi:fibronectin type 3 domain-containing protein